MKFLSQLRAALPMALAFLAAATGQCAPAVSEVTTPEQAANAEAFRRMRHGIFVHQVYRLTSWHDGRKSGTLDEFAEAFDVSAFADQMAAIGVEYVYFTAWHKWMYLLAPNAALEKWLPGHSAKRDLVGEIADALHAKGIKLVIYAHPNDGHDLPPEEQARVGYIPYDKADPKPIPVFNDFINEVYAELAARYADKPNVIGFWWDSWWSNGDRVDMPRLRQTVLSRFPGAIILSNKFNKRFVDFMSHEILYKKVVGDDLHLLVPHDDNQTFPVAGNWWAVNTRNQRIVLSPESMFRFLLLNVGTGAPGGVTWAVSPMSDGKTWTENNQPYETLMALNQFITPVRPAITQVLPSKNRRLPAKTTWPDAPAFVAARSASGNVEYIHVIKPPAGPVLELPAGAEPVVAARLFLSRKALGVELRDGKLLLTLPAGESWDPLCTVLELAVAN